MTKRELLDRIGQGGVKGRLAAKRIGRSKEMHDLPDHANIDRGTVERWIEQSPRLSGGLYRDGIFSLLSESDFRLIDRHLLKD